MRIVLNLNRYYEGLNLEQINTIFRKMVSLKLPVDALRKYYREQGLSDSNYSESFKGYNKYYAAKKMLELDDYVYEARGERIFGVDKDTDYKTFDFGEAIKKYDFLMSEPEEGQE